MAGGIYEDVIFTKQLTASSKTANIPLTVDQNADAIALSITSAATTSSVFTLDVLGSEGGSIARFQESGGNYFKINSAADVTGSYHFFRNATATATAAPVVFIEQDHGTDDQPALKIQQDGLNSGILITTVTANGAPLELTPQAAPPATAREGMIYMDTDHHLYVHNGTTWVQLDN